VVPVLRRLHAMPGVQVVATVTPPDKPRGRGSDPKPLLVKLAAEAREIPVLQPPNLDGESILAELARLAPDVIVVAAYGKFLPKTVLELPPHGCLNLHPSLLPRHRGPSPVIAAILEGDAVTGVSLMLMDEGMDTGPVIASAGMSLSGGETSGELEDTLFEMGGGLLLDSLGPWVCGRLSVTPQDEALATVSRKFKRSHGIDWSVPAETIARRCRAFDPRPGSHTHWNGRRLKLLSVSQAQDAPDSPGVVGRVVMQGPLGGLKVETGRGTLSLDLVQLEGGEAVSGCDFVNGHPGIIGAILKTRNRSVRGRNCEENGDQD
jgi:methionyl-tRNA formyltransferase